MIGGRPHVLEFALRGDVALIAADRADRWGNLTYRLSARNFGPVMAAAADARQSPGSEPHSAAWVHRSLSGRYAWHLRSTV